MSAATFSQAHDKGLRRYFADVSNAARAFAAALFAAQERQFVAQPVVDRPLSARAREKSRSQLFAMAKQYQDVSPNMAAELRYFAACS